MMLSRDDVIVFDEEYTYAAKEINDYCEALIKMIDTYSECVSEILENAIRDKAITERLQTILASVEAVKPDIEAIGQQASEACKNYIAAVDSEDDFLY